MKNASILSVSSPQNTDLSIKRRSEIRQRRPAQLIMISPTCQSNRCLKSLTSFSIQEILTLLRSIEIHHVPFSAFKNNPILGTELPTHTLGRLIVSTIRPFQEFIYMEYPYFLELLLLIRSHTHRSDVTLSTVLQLTAFSSSPAPPLQNPSVYSGTVNILGCLQGPFFKKHIISLYCIN